MERILLDMPYVAALVHPPEFCIARNWGPFSTHEHESPRYGRLRQMQLEALETLLLFDRVVLPELFAGIRETVAGEEKSWTPEIDDLKKLAKYGHIEFLEPPEEPKGKFLFDSAFARAAKYLLQADASRDVGGDGINDWEYDFLVDVLASGKDEELRTITEAHMGWVIREAVHMGNVRTEGPPFELREIAPLVGKAMNVVKVPRKDRREYERAMTRALQRFDTSGRIKSYSKEQVDSLVGELGQVKSTYQRLALLLHYSAERGLSLKVDVPLDASVASRASGQHVEGSGIAILPIVVEELERFPAVESISDVERHLSQPYITNLRTALREWREALVTGAKSEARLRGDIRKCSEEAIRHTRRWRKTGNVLTVTSLVSGAAGTGVGVVAVPAGVVLGAVSILAGVGAWSADLLAKKAARERGWLLMGSEG